MKLYYLPGACSFTPHVVLRELELPFDLEKVDFATKKTASGEDFLGVNPNGYVPALRLDSGDVLTEGPAIVQYLADLKPEKRLAPPNGTLARVRLQETLNFIATELHKGCGALFDDALPEAGKAALREQLRKRLAHVAARLERTPYLLGEFGVADIYLFNVLSWADYVGIDLAGWPSLIAFNERIAARPAVIAARAAEAA